jgi:hypothetical protein
MNRILTIDPGKKGFGFCIGDSLDFRIITCGYLLVQDDLSSFLKKIKYYKVFHIIMEKPIIRINHQIRQSDILDLSISLGFIWGNIFSKNKNLFYKLVPANKWTKGVNKQKRIEYFKATHSKTMIKISKFLTNKKTIDHNIMDAICLYEWYQKEV